MTLCCCCRCRARRLYADLLVASSASRGTPRRRFRFLCVTAPAELHPFLQEAVEQAKRRGGGRAFVASNGGAA